MPMHADIHAIDVLFVDERDATTSSIRATSKASA
jgi:hypothetical protein